MATTVNSRKDSVMGDLRVVIANLSLSAASDTYNTGLGTVVAWTCDGGSAAITTTTVATGTFTMTSTAGSNNVSLVAYGY